MNPIEIVPFREEQLEEAAALVSRRYKLLRSGMPMLPARKSREHPFSPPR